MERRTLIRALVGLGIGIPVAIEGVTFAELFRNQFGGDDRETTRETTTAAPTADERGVGVGDDLLPESPRTERVTGAVIDAANWRLELSVRVENGGSSPYVLSLGDATMPDGTVVEGGGATPELAPGESATLTATWDLPDGTTPETVAVTASNPGGDAAVSTTTQVSLAKVPVRSG